MSSPSDQLSERELKFALPREREAVVSAWLSALCEPDSAHPENEVVSVYFDTPELAALSEKLDGDDRKTKVRLRWYEDPRGARPSSPVFLEIKGRSGGTRFKVHTELGFEVAEILAQPLDRRMPPAFTAALAQHGVASPERLLPVVELRYSRSRFVEPWSGTRMALDRAIHAARSHPRLLPRATTPHLPFAVLEAKGTGRELPERLRQLLALGCRPAAISKYALVLAALGGPGEDL